MAMNADHPKLIDYISKVDGYDGEQLLFVCLERRLFDAAFALFKKFQSTLSATDVSNLNS